MNGPDRVESSLGALSEGPAIVPGLRGVAEMLDRAGFRPEALRTILAVSGDISTAPADLAVYERRLAANPGPLADLVALFVLGWNRPLAAVVAVLGGPGLDVMISSGAVREDAGSVRAEIRLIPHGDVWIAADRRLESGATVGALHVTGINPPATLLAAMTVRRPVGRALDIGTGSGIQSLLAARHCEEVVATDVNPRALAFAGFNAALNGVSGVELRLGSLFEPVAGERFDLIVSNPPYVISPDHDLVYRDSGQEPGALCAALVGGAPEHLADEGYATVLASWPLQGDRPWSDVPRSWLSDGCRAWLMQLNEKDTLHHAGQWNSPLAALGDLDGFCDAVDRWVAYTSARGIQRIGYGAVVMQQHPGRATVVRVDEVQAGRGAAGAHLERVFAAHRFLSGVSDDAIADLRCDLPAGHKVERSVRLVDGEWHADSAVVTLEEGVGIEVTLDPVMTEIFLLVTSGGTVREAAQEVVQRSGADPEQVDLLAYAATAMVRDLLGLGIMLAVPAAGAA